MSDIQSASSDPVISAPFQMTHGYSSSLSNNPKRKVPNAAKQSLVNLSLGMGIMLAALSGGVYLMMTNKEVLLGGKASVDKQSSFSFAAPTQVKPGEQFTVDVMLDTSADPEYTISGADAVIQYSFTPEQQQTVGGGGGGVVPIQVQPFSKTEEPSVTGAIREVTDGSRLGLGSGGPNVGDGSGGGISWEEQQRIKPMMYPMFTLVKTEQGSIFDSYPANPTQVVVPSPSSTPVPQIQCGGIRGLTCPDNMRCEYVGGPSTSTDSMGTCISVPSKTYPPEEPLPPTKTEVPPSQIMCGGIAGISCPADMYCYMAMKTPDASGYCLPNGTNVKGTDGTSQVLGATTIKSKKLAMTTDPSFSVDPRLPATPPPNSPPSSPGYIPSRTIQGTTSISGVKNYSVDDQGYFKGFTGKGVFARLTFVANTTGKVELKFAYNGATATDDSNINGFLKNVPVNIQKSAERLLTEPASLQVMIVEPVVIAPSPSSTPSSSPVPPIGLACNQKCGAVPPPAPTQPCAEVSAQISGHTLGIDQSKNIYTNWGGLNEKWFVDERSGSDRWYYLYKGNDDVVRVLSWNSGSGLTQGGKDVGTDKQVAVTSQQCYDALQPNFAFPSPDYSYLQGVSMPSADCAPGLACVGGFCRNTACSDQTSCLCGGATPKPESRCNLIDCQPGYECYQPPMPPCKEGNACIQMMPAPYCKPLPMPSGAPTPTPIPTPTSTPRPSNQVSWRTGAATLDADDFEISITRNGVVKKYYARSGNVTVHSDMNPQNPTLEISWTENDIPMRLFVYFTNLGYAWKVNEIRTYDGSSLGEWIYFRDFGIKSLFNEIFISPKFSITSSDRGSLQDGSVVTGTILFDNLRLQDLLSVKPTPTPTPPLIPERPEINIALALEGRTNHATNALVYQVIPGGERLLGQVQTDANGNGSIKISDPNLLYSSSNLRLFVEVPGYLRGYNLPILRSSAIQVTDGSSKLGIIHANFGLLTAGDVHVDATGFGDHQINSVDIADMYTQWSTATEPDGNPALSGLSGDLNGDGIVNNRDYAIIMMNFGKKAGVVK